MMIGGDELTGRSPELISIPPAVSFSSCKYIIEYIVIAETDINVNSFFDAIYLSFNYWTYIRTRHFIFLLLILFKLVAK